MTKHIAIARPNQYLEDHLFSVSLIAKNLASKINLENCGELIGLIHDVGKYSKAFQDYINAPEDDIDFDLDGKYVNQKKHKAKIDHSTSGAKWIWSNWQKYGQSGKICAQILALCITSHHGGLIDCLNPDGTDVFIKRMNKSDNETNYSECFATIADSELSKTIEQLGSEKLILEICKKLSSICKLEKLPKIQAFHFGCIIKFLLSCLIDADRINSAFPDKVYQKLPVRWNYIAECFEKNLDQLPIKTRIDEIRRQISNDCYAKAKCAQGIYTLTVPTGGGKTYSSFRYALHHAKIHNLDHIIYVIPYTTIIEQNAEAIRKILGDEAEDLVLEHHSNLEPEQQTWQSKIIAENWDVPIVLTTMAQFLEILFGGGTRDIRRMHQLANSVIIFDEIQTLPIKCVHMFCNALNFLVQHAKTTVILCTATQPLLDELKCPEKGQLSIPKDNKLVSDIEQLFTDLQRVEVINKCRENGWKLPEISEFAINEFNEKNNCLIIVNTKSYAQKLYQSCKDKSIAADALFHLSTHQCPAHRKVLLNTVKDRLQKNLPVLCISTQLIEAGVDIDFASVIRFLAGFDSIAQAAGRCNRNGELKDKNDNFLKGVVYVFNPADENLNKLEEIKSGCDTMKRIFDEEKKRANNLLSPEIIRRYFKYYFFDRANEMDYKVNKLASGDSLLDLLTDNKHNSNGSKLLRQSFKTAGEIFQAIEAPTRSVIVQYGYEGKKIVAKLCGIDKKFDGKKYRELLRKAQRFSVNLFPYEWDKLQQQQAIIEIQKNHGIFYLKENFYSKNFGVSLEETELMNVYYSD